MEELIQAVLTLLATIVTGVITVVVIPRIVKYFEAKTNNENVKAVLAELGQTVATSVGFLNQTFVNQLKADGKFDLEAQQKALTDAATEVINGLSQKAKDIISTDEEKLTQIVIRWIEDEIDNRK